VKFRKDREEERDRQPEEEGENMVRRRGTGLSGRR